jgi:hypothetical protein
MEWWEELQQALRNQPSRHGENGPPSVYTLGRQVPNDIIGITPAGIVVRSDRTDNPDPIGVEVFQAWWEHLQVHGRASVVPENPNCPHPYRSRVVGAIWAQCLPQRIEWDEAHNEIRLIGHPAVAGHG